MCGCDLKATDEDDCSISKLKTTLLHTEFCTLLYCFQILPWGSSLL